MDADSQIAMEAEQEEESVEGGVAMETSTATLEELASAVLTTPTLISVLSPVLQPLPLPQSLFIQPSQEPPQ